MAAHRCSSFAQEQLEKHGWKGGQGLGRTESGISEAIKVKRKHDTAGVGHDLGEQFTYHWWDHVFNKAASNIVVETDQDGVKLSRKENTQGLISNKKLSKDRGKKPLLYGNFVKSATLTTEGLQLDDVASSSSSEEDGDPEETNIDDKFFKACGGRTAHKGARHGLNLSGKLKRIQAQEDAQVPQPPEDISTKNPKCSLRDIDEDDRADKKRRKKQRKKDKQKLDKRVVDANCSDLVIGIDVSDTVIVDGKAIVTHSNEESKRKQNKKNKRKMVENSDLNNHEYSAETREFIFVENSDSKAARKKARRDERKRAQEIKNSCRIADVKTSKLPDK